MPPPESRSVATVQDVDRSRPKADAGPSIDVFTWRVGARISECPPYWSRSRDEWLVEWIKADGNDLLAGAHSTLVAKIASTGWYIEGPLTLAMLYKDVLLRQIGWGSGWHAEVSKWVDAFLSRDLGGCLEKLRSSTADYTGPALGFAHMDESKCYPTGVPEWPLFYHNSERGVIPVHRSQVIWITDMPDHRDKYRGVGFCSASRVLGTAEIMSMLVKYKKQSLSDLPPAGLLFVGNMTRTQWEDIQERYDARQERRGNTVWRDILTAFSLDPAYPLTVEFVELSKLWEHFDEKVATEMAIYAFALGYRVDAREYWPVSGGPLGTAHEAEIQHRKAKAKGEGIIFHAIERGLNDPTSLPPLLNFKFDYRDDEEDRIAAEIAEVKIRNIRRLWEASPNRLVPAPGSASDRPAGRPEGEGEGEPADEDAAARASATVDLAPGEEAEARLGIISTEEARQLLVHWNVVPPEILGQQMDVGRIYDVRHIDPKRLADMYGPTCRVYRDGRVEVMKRPMIGPELRDWLGYTIGN